MRWALVIGLAIVIALGLPSIPAFEPIPDVIWSIITFVIVLLAWYICTRYPEWCGTLVIVKKWSRILIRFIRDPMTKALLELIVRALEVGTGQVPIGELKKVREDLEKLIVKYVK